MEYILAFQMSLFWVTCSYVLFKSQVLLQLSLSKGLISIYTYISSFHASFSSWSIYFLEMELMTPWWEMVIWFTPEGK